MLLIDPPNIKVITKFIPNVLAIIVLDWTAIDSIFYAKLEFPCCGGNLP